MASSDRLISDARSGIKSVLERTKASDAFVLRSAVPSMRLQVFETTVPGTSCKLYKAVIDIPYHVDTIFASFLDLKSRLIWDQNVAALETAPVAEMEPSPDFKHGNPRYLILHSATKAVGPISGRDFTDCIFLGPLSALPADVRSCAPDELGTTTVGGSGKCLINAGAGVAEGHSAFPETSAFVRGSNFPGCGWVLAPIAGPSDTSASAPAVPSNSNGWTRVYYVVHTDLKGWLPTAIVNSSMVNMFHTFFTNFLGHMAKQDFSKKG